MVNRSRGRLGSRLTPLVVPRDLLRDRLRDLLLSPSLLEKLSPCLQSSLLELLNSSCRQTQASMLRRLHLRLQGFCFLLASSALRLVLLELQEVL